MMFCVALLLIVLGIHPFLFSGFQQKSVFHLLSIATHFHVLFYINHMSIDFVSDFFFRCSFEAR